MREKIKLESTAGTGHFYTTTKNKRTTPDKMEIKKYDPRRASTLSTRKPRSNKDGRLTPPLYFSRVGTDAKRRSTRGRKSPRKRAFFSFRPAYDLRNSSHPACTRFFRSAVAGADDLAVLGLVSVKRWSA